MVKVDGVCLVFSQPFLTQSATLVSQLPVACVLSADLDAGGTCEIMSLFSSHVTLSLSPTDLDRIVSLVISFNKFSLDVLLLY